MEGLSKKEKGLVDNRVVIGGGRRYKRTKWEWKNIVKIIYLKNCVLLFPLHSLLKS